MKALSAILAGVLTLCLTPPAVAQQQEEDGMLIIAHRGASGERPEHTLAAYELAIDQGADYIEPDLVATKDGVLIARHENEISGTTDIDQRPEFAARLTTRVIDGKEVTGWFTEDFTLEELRTLRARERLPDIRPGNTAYDGLYLIPTLDEIIALVRAKEAETGRVIGLYPEIKHPGYFRSIGHDLADMLVDALYGAGYDQPDAPVFIQSFEVDPLVKLNELSEFRLVQLIEADNGPADRPEWTAQWMTSPEGLEIVSQYSDAIGADLRLLMPPINGAPTLAEKAHDAGLLVHGWTVRRENAFLEAPFRNSSVPQSIGCLSRIWDALNRWGLDGFFTDNPREFVELRNGEERSDRCMPIRHGPVR